jgi:(p)ppGpp synthase/HD superfamily hydrolase
MLADRQRAELFAREAFGGLVHRDGKPAVEHSIRVAGAFEDDVLACIALLHDVLEDCPKVRWWHIAYLFGRRVARGVRAMTRGKTQSWNSYIRQVSLNRDAVRVKIADIEDNLARADDRTSDKLRMYRDALRKLRKIPL